MESLRRGDVVIGVAPKDIGKPRPMVVIQADVYEEHPTVTICPVTSHIIPEAKFRVMFSDQGSGLNPPSQAMVDKIMTIQRDKVRQVIGRLSNMDMFRLDESIKHWLGLE